MIKVILLILGIALIWIGVIRNNDKIKYPNTYKYATTAIAFGGILIGASLLLFSKQGVTGITKWDINY